ncbi:MAG: Holliday junction resolvase RuvX [Sphingomonadales bacterium]|nr:Holliday junction resolvase RuvX [Sphingomonadales bacterium]
MARFIALDYGRKRCGLAHSDQDGRIALGLGTVETTALMKYLDAYPAWNEVQALILGLPLQSNQSPSENTERTLAFGRKLAAKRPHIPIHLMDERFTSVMAQQSLIESGVSRSARRDKGVVDQIAAVILLQDFLEMHHHDRTDRLPILAP